MTLLRRTLITRFLNQSAIDLIHHLLQAHQTAPYSIKQLVAPPLIPLFGSIISARRSHLLFSSLISSSSHLSLPSPPFPLTFALSIYKSTHIPTATAPNMPPAATVFTAPAPIAIFVGGLAVPDVVALPLPEPLPLPVPVPVPVLPAPAAVPVAEGMLPHPDPEVPGVPRREGWGFSKEEGR